MQWWGWIIIGTLIFCAELFAIDAQFYLIFLGAGALTVGAVMLFGVDIPAWGQWLLFAVLSVISMVTFRRKLYDKIRGGVPAVMDAAVGKAIVLQVELQPGATGRTEYRGTTWTAMNIGSEAIPAGGNATIESMDGFTLRLKLTQQ